MKKQKYDDLENKLKTEKVNTWFDMGLFLDHIRDNRKPISHLPKTFESYKNLLCNGIAFITFDYGIDGATIEIAKYTRAFNDLIKNTTKPEPKIYWIGSKLKLKQESIEAKFNFFELKGSNGFDEWDGYRDYFFNKLERGGDKYNQLAKKIWQQTVNLSLQLGKLIVDKNINLLIPVNVNSNPGNVSLAFAIVLVSEIMGIPVLNNNHDFYWEDGNPPNKRKKPGLRDHFFTNSHLGEIFSLIEVLYPWDSPPWFQTVINPLQKNKLIKKFGFNPVAVANIPTFVDTKKYRPVSKDDKNEILKRLHFFFSGSQDVLYSKSITRYINSLKTKQYQAPVILGCSDKTVVRFKGANILILQPTRILRRKRIERNFGLISTLFRDKKFKVFFEQNTQMSIVLLITGPVSTGQEDYFLELIRKFKSLLNEISRLFRERVFLALKFGIENTTYMSDRGLKPIGIEEIYAAADIVVLPSESEGRGLPIIESCACGTPIIVNRYKPEKVFASVIGEHLDKSKRLNVVEFPKEDSSLPRSIIEFFNLPEKFSKIVLQNRKNVKKRYGLEALEKILDKCLYTLWKRSSQPNEENKRFVKDIFEFHKKITLYDASFKQIALTNHRKYYAGFSPVEFMMVLKSLIDPSYFRMEEKELKSRLMSFAKRLIHEYSKYEKLEFEKELHFYNLVDAFFEYFEGDEKINMDHSLSYRHRHNRHYPFRKLTEYELSGLIAEMFRRLVKNPNVIPLKKRSVSLSQYIHSSLMMLVGYRKLAIDDSELLVQALKSKRSFAWFPGNKWHFEIEILVVETLKFRLGLSPEDKITKDKLTHINLENIGKIYLFVRSETIGSPIYYRNILIWLEKLANSEIKAVYEAGLFNVVKTDVISAGTHLAQLGTTATQKLIEIKKQDGFVVAIGENNYLTLDLIDLPSFRIGVARHPFVINYLGINKNEEFIQWIPAGMSPCLAYPTPVQTAKDFSLTLKSNIFNECMERYGKKKLLKKLRDETDKSNSSIKEILSNILNLNSQKAERVESKYIETRNLTGIHSDNLPWSGALTKVHFNVENGSDPVFEFHSVFAKKATTVLDMVKKFEKKQQKKVAVAWNGGYMLNAELVGKLGLPEKYIGSPLGLVIKDGEIISLPLYNKPAFAIDKNFEISIRETQLNNGLKISVVGGDSLAFNEKDKNCQQPDGPVFYNLLYPSEKISAKNKIIYRIAGNKIIAKIKTQDKYIPILPVGITVSVPAEMKLKGWNVGKQVKFMLPEWSDVLQAVESGPLLVNDGKLALDMVKEGWKTKFSIATQAARVDYENLRGPKIGAGITAQNQLVIVAINGRIRESVGATHIELAKILIDQGCEKAMGFDPGGSVTLVVNGKQLNISPYNQNYEMNPYSLPPQPRKVGNAILLAT